ncbi:biotin--[acetyl-CoA-carboxylase] ligase [Campylobacter insulaenigrae]|uniref:Biotin-[acetyl-CoA-carboxylase] ligase n=2 Tax=Campylobacter insulaenigrae TaxID=260714 RepID=A0A0A8GZI5_9BACT|nr:biotin--[acetyl-CoA-carboxylase] ligase [Campylobacter insulaenigrae]AJC87181.1 biotin-[acetyl-CoA-carboxylase] ligase [Campylobacter insulaenigrae NCTC 12927]MCR6571159.1 biotin--[acetyl-CoA-carboxylase] ligase [Campylobacter insulaenigrae]MCR6572886.1 biotin--[acetyl-CoA-carboxylase] ligase [Campylobacter insulaenigrae]MCR6583540.1 biotin--[acetyl-CoA-carboxylase] ligase [Campylobacter insulaenigrae]TWO25914.1 biotin--[acetyl-CoA-carboxylase] ligase [Campylobacter insulaenigrae]
MEITYFDELDSTQMYLCEKIRSNEINHNNAICAFSQTAGIGSRENLWQSKKGNLHVSFCIRIEDLPNDLPLASASIYFAFLMKEILEKRESKVWIKWPNDFYIDDKKIGGLMSSKINDFLVIGIGINLKFAPFNAEILDIEVDIKELLNAYFSYIKKKILWKNIFSKYMLEFEKSRKFFIHNDGDILSLNDALLYKDGSILLDNKRIYSLR